MEKKNDKKDHRKRKKTGSRKKKAVWLGSSLIGLALAGCGFSPSQNEEETLSGPSADYYEEDTQDPEIEFSPELNEQMCIYGPPEMFE